MIVLARGNDDVKSDCFRFIHNNVCLSFAESNQKKKKKMSHWTNCFREMRYEKSISKMISISSYLLANEL